MQLSPLQLEDYLLKDLRFTLNSPLLEVPDPSVKYDSVGIEVNAETEMRADDPLAWRCEVIIRTKDVSEGNYPYSFQLIYVGFFRVVKDFPADRIQQMVKVNGPALLYGAAREAIMYLTGRGRYPAVLLPSITFLEPPPKAAAKALTAAKKKVAKKR